MSVYLFGPSWFERNVTDVDDDSGVWMGSIEDIDIYFCCDGFVMKSAEIKVLLESDLVWNGMHWLLTLSYITDSDFFN